MLACVDQSAYGQSVSDAATWAARRLQAPMELLHVIDRHPRLASGQDHSGAIGLDAQESLLKQLSDEDEARTRAAREAGRAYLNGLRERALAAGAFVVDVRQRHGSLDTTLAELQDGVRLFVLGRRGASAQDTQRDLGRQLEWVVRSVSKPVLAVPQTFQAPSRVLFAFDGSAVTRQGVRMIAASPLLKGLPVHLLMAGKAQAQGPRQIEEARQALEAVGFSVTTDIQPGDPETAIASVMRSLQCDLLVMGVYSHSPWRSLFMGSKTTDLLRSAAAPTLLLR
ncbi:MULTISPECIES: universal stress protein [unclassified Hydrogenophaga]|uniref:universal stress protein n=1 Tax=unclassified Hydrogenophaga TaxID=2610897 RepID=UPI000966E5E1|nr:MULTISPECIES: universal stress protein [unclassified Hydrogenophaga]MBN9373541.1 universal stress protein [Hydrogenophaga sp.]OJV62829.1 MAG: universal stress protein A [Hydrogenophaga sp. 70-12]